MDAHDKFQLFVANTADPLSFIGAAWTAGTAQMSHDDKAYRMGMAGYGKRYSAAVTDNITGEFFSTFLYPSLFHQDPRYYRQGSGRDESRLGTRACPSLRCRQRFRKSHAQLLRMVRDGQFHGVGQSVSSRKSAGFGPSASRVGFHVGNDMAWDVLREFWPEIAHKLHLPFRTHEDVH